ncbi:glycosyl transferase family 2, partial [Xanthomonas sp. Kuri4-2]
MPLSSAAPLPPELSVVICTLDEHEAIGSVLRALSVALAQVSHEILVVDDSRDERTAQAVIACARTQRTVRLLRRREGQGL